MSLGVHEARRLPGWQQKVRELSDRGFRIEYLLDFCEVLGRNRPFPSRFRAVSEVFRSVSRSPTGTRKVMPHFDAARSSTNDVVRQALIPWSLLAGEWPKLRQGEGEPELYGMSMAQRMGSRKAPVFGASFWVDFHGFPWIPGDVRPF